MSILEQQEQYQRSSPDKDLFGDEATSATNPRIADHCVDDSTITET
jgi:hypothetical protein